MNFHILTFCMVHVTISSKWERIGIIPSTLQMKNTET